jgi:hypothetical protein
MSPGPGAAVIGVCTPVGGKLGVSGVAMPDVLFARNLTLWRWSWTKGHEDSSRKDIREVT